jgi:voltage-gated potassium channel
MTIITIASVGYEEVVDLSGDPFGRFFTIMLIIIGVIGYMYFISSFTAVIVEGRIFKTYRRKKMENFLKNLSSHYILCGCGNTGFHIANELYETKRNIVIIESNPKRVEFLKTKFDCPLCIIIEGDATEDDTLNLANISNSAGVFVCLPEDKDNLLITFTARTINETIRIVSRCIQTNMQNKLRRAGANAIISPNFIGGMRMASEMIRPAAVTFLDIMLRDKDKNLRVEDISIDDNSNKIGKSLGEISFWDDAGLFPIAVKLDADNWIYNPTPNHIIKKGQTLVIIGNSKQREAVNKIMRG